jgi:hypothetical protein
MKVICNGITAIALAAFMLALCSIESLSAGTLVTMFVSGAWLVGYGFVTEELKREEEGR